MSSNLTRPILHRILNNRPILHVHCISKPSQVTPTRRNGAAAIPLSQRRPFGSLFNWDTKPARTLRDPRISPGVEAMAQVTRRQLMKARMPEHKPLLRAFKEFWIHKIKKKAPCRDFELQHVVATYYVLQGSDQAKEMDSFILEAPFKLMRSLAKPTAGTSKFHLELAQLLFDASSETNLQDGKWTKGALNLLIGFILVQCHHGAPEKAPALVEQYLKGISKTDFTTIPLTGALTYGLMEAKNVGLVKEIILRDAVPMDTHAEVFYFLAKNGEKDLALKHFQKLVQKFEIQDNAGSREKAGVLIRTSWKMGEPHVVENVVRKVLQVRSPVSGQEQGPGSHTYLLASTIAWAAATGKSISEVDRMLGVLANTQGSVEAHAINELLQVAIHRSDPYLAERYLDLGRKYGVAFDHTTYTLQLRYRLDARDFDGALSTLRMLETEVEPGGEIPAPVTTEMNRYIVEVLRHEPKLMESAHQICGLLMKNGLKLLPETVSAMCLIHLEKDEFFDAIDLLQYSVPQYSSKERDEVRAHLVTLCLKPETTTARAWDIYMIFRQVFDETPREIRTQVMVHFYNRDRPDLAVHVFDHMRQHNNPEIRPSLETYTAALSGIAKARDHESLEHVYNQLKLDTDVDPDTRLWNAVMLAHLHCFRPDQALEVWNQIQNSREGPSYNSIAIAFRCCETSDYAHNQTEILWQKLRRYNIEIDKAILLGYMGALVGQGQFEKVFDIATKADQEFGIKVDVEMLGTMINASREMAVQASVLDWAQQSYPLLWDEMEKIGFDEDEMSGKMTLKMDRELKA